jgi:amidohydrolase
VAKSTAVRCESLDEQMLRVRRAIHAAPELSNREVATTALVGEELERCGIKRIHLLEGSGLVADVVGDRPGAVVAVRADLDALPIHESADVEFRSRLDGVMHACGHDVHTAMVRGVGVAAARRRSFPGTIRLIFQPAEEAEPLGARRVIAAGHVVGVRGVIALHVDPSLPTGQVALRDGPMMASSDVFTVTIRGSGSHAGWPHEGGDAIAAAAQFISQLHSVLARRVDPRVPAVVHFGRIQGGTANNIVADLVTVDGVIRTFDERLRPELQELLTSALDCACTLYGVEGHAGVTAGEPVLNNDPTLAAHLRSAARGVFGDDMVVGLAQPTLSGEDFAFYGQYVPVAMAWLGVRDEARGYVHPLHHPEFAVDEEAMTPGSAMLLAAALEILEQEIASDSDD